MICPKCNKKLELIKTKYGNYYGHTWSIFDVLMFDKKVCDYSQGR